MAPGTGNFTKSNATVFPYFQGLGYTKISQKSDASIFSNFHDPGVFGFWFLVFGFWFLVFGF
jgi:hypothetical protein